MVVTVFIKKEVKKSKSGKKTYIRIVESYRDGGKNKHRPVKSYGALEDQADPELFLKRVEEDLIELEENKGQDLVLTIKAEDNRLNAKNNVAHNYGHTYLERIYDYLEIGGFLDTYQTSLSSRERYSLSSIFKFLVFERILAPDSKRANMQRIKLYYGKHFDFSLDDAYRSMDLMEPIYKDLQVHMRKKIDALTKASDDHVYYDVTNYYCEIDFNDLLDGLRKRGVSKEHRLDPIVGLGLFMDSDGLPLAFQIFPGNTAESTTLISGIREVKKQNNKKRILCVADKGLNTNKNIAELILNQDGYLFSQTLRGPKGKNLHDVLFSDDGWVKRTDDQGVVVHQYKVHKRIIKLKTDNNEEIEHEQKVLIYWNKEEFDMQQKKRDEQVSRAQKALTNKAYQIEHGFKKYIKKEAQGKEGLTINQELIEQEARFDGYFCLVTSELHFDHQEIKRIYGNLWEIEDTFRVTKTDLEFRPIHHYKHEHIIAHFLICFTALIILRLFQHKLKNQGIHLSAERIVGVLNRMNVEKTTTDIYHLHAVSGAQAYRQILNKDQDMVYTNTLISEDMIEKDLKLIHLAFDAEMDEAYVKVEKFNRYLRKIKFHTISA
jgi:transposase